MPLVLRSDKGSSLTYEELDGNFVEVVSIATGVFPPGTIMFFGGTVAPTGFLKLNGATISRTVYSELFAKVGTVWGAGNGSTTFTLLDARGEFVRCWDDGRGVDAGRTFGSAQGDAIRNITGSYSTNHSLGLGIPTVNTGAIYPSGDTGGSQSGDIGSGYQKGFTFDASLVVPTANENRPRNISLLACIKY